MAWLTNLLRWLFRRETVISEHEIVYMPLEPIPEASKQPPVTVIELEPEIVPPKPKTPSERLYDVAFESMGKRMGLDRTVPIELNCANALSHVLILAGVKGLPKKGIAGTANLYEWLKKSKDFKQIKVPEVGSIVIYPTGYDAPEIPGMPSLSNGHVFIKGKFQMLSNNSKNGRWDNLWKSLDAADTYYTKLGGIARYCFRWNPQ